MTSEQKIEYIAKQITAMQKSRRLGIKRSIRYIACPYCDAKNFEGNPLCCVLMGRAVAAILINKDDKERAEHAERILEKVQAN